MLVENSVISLNIFKFLKNTERPTRLPHPRYATDFREHGGGWGFKYQKSTKNVSHTTTHLSFVELNQTDRVTNFLLVASWNLVRVRFETCVSWRYFYNRKKSLFPRKNRQATFFWQIKYVRTMYKDLVNLFRSYKI